MDKTKEKQFIEDSIKAYRIIVSNSQLLNLTPEEQLQYVFAKGVEFGKSGEIPADLTNDKNFMEYGD